MMIMTRTDLTSFANRPVCGCYFASSLVECLGSLVRVFDAVWLEVAHSGRRSVAEAVNRPAGDKSWVE